ncbi:MAG: hypothetical protein GH144_09580 [Clostridia bacterium]|nr:hypothetical protein [Clostridia bacterium]
MIEKLKELLESMEKMKEVQRIVYDYFKHLTTLSTGLILIIVAFLEKVFSDPIGIPYVVISVICFALCLIGSLLALPSPGNIILYMTAMRISLQGEDAEKAIKEGDKTMKVINKTVNRMKIYDHVTRYSFLAGIIAFLIFAGINFFN